MHKRKILNGTIKRHPDGFGFFIPEDIEHPDVYIPRHSMEGVMTNDKVAIEAFPEREADRYRGEIVRILSRGTKVVVGRFFKLNDKYGILRDEGKGWGQDLKIKLEDSLNAKDKELVTAEITQYPEKGVPFIGIVKEIIGDALDPMTDILRVIRSNGIPLEFSKATLDQASKFAEDPTEEDFKNRRDLRDRDLITIDGATAKDFDDAICVEMTNEGFLLTVAIADVSHYVRVDSAIDRDAYERGTSVYFPNYVVPMLPEALSNGLCSLNPHRPRLCLVAEMLFDFTGDLRKSEFFEGVMSSKARVTYGEAQEIIDGNPIEKFKDVAGVILRAADLAKLLMAKRFKEGSLDLEIPETELVIDGAGVPIDIQKSERLFSHRLIEEMMLAANVAVAKFITEKEIPALYRIHEPPNEQAIMMLERYLQNFGSETKLGQGKLQKRLTRALQEFTGKPEAQVLNILTLRSMNQAKYSLNNLGHFGLGFEFYTHFTSPIRRYPDLIVHRLLKNLVLPNGGGYRLMPEDEVSSAGTVLSAAEQRSTKAERQLQSIKKARFMEKFIGQEFDGIISSVAKFGVFVLLREYDVDGLVKLEELTGDRFEFDEENLTLVGRRSGFTYNIGDLIRIQVASADVDLGQINFVLAGAEARDEDAPTTAERSASGFLKKLRKKDKGNKNDQDDYRDKKSAQKKSFKDKNDKHRPETRSDSRKDRHENRSEDTRATQGKKPGKKGSGQSKYFDDRRQDTNGQREKLEKVEKQSRRPIIDDQRDTSPNKSLLEMILGPAKYRTEALGEKSNDNGPKLSKKLMFAENSKLRDNDEYSEKNSDTLKDRATDRKDPKKRGKTSNNRGSVRKARVSSGRGKSKAR